MKLQVTSQLVTKILQTFKLSDTFNSKTAVIALLVVIYVVTFLKKIISPNKEIE